MPFRESKTCMCLPSPCGQCWHRNSTECLAPLSVLIKVVSVLNLLEIVFTAFKMFLVNSLATCYTASRRQFM